MEGGGQTQDNLIINQSIEQGSKQGSNQSINQSINQSFHHSINLIKSSNQAITNVLHKPSLHIYLLRFQKVQQKICRLSAEKILRFGLFTTERQQKSRRKPRIHQLHFRMFMPLHVVFLQNPTTSRAIGHFRSIRTRRRRSVRFQQLIPFALLSPGGRRWLRLFGRFLRRKCLEKATFLGVSIGGTSVISVFRGSISAAPEENGRPVGAMGIFG